MNRRCWISVLVIWAVLAWTLAGAAADGPKVSKAFQALPQTLGPEFEKAPDIALPEPGQDLALTVEGAVFLVLQNNRDLKIRQLAPVIAGTFAQIETAVFDPQWFGELSWAREMGNVTSQDRTVEARVGQTRKLASGTTLTTDLGYDKDSSEKSGSRHNTRAEMSLTQPLLRGRGRLVTLAAVRQREMDTMASFDELEGFIQALVSRTEIAYWQYVLALREIEIFQSSLAVATQQRQEVEAQIEVGLLPDNEAAAARAEEASREQDLINARSLVAERRMALLALINAERPDTEILAQSRPAIHTDPVGDARERIALALVARPDLREAELRQDQGRLEVAVTKNGLLPQLDFFAGLGINGFGASPGESLAHLSPHAYDIGAGIRISQFAGSQAEKARHRAALATLDQAGMAMDNLRHLIRYQVSLAVNEAERARQQIFASQKTREFEEQTVVSEQERFAVGAGTSLLVARAQRDLLASRIAEVRAVIQYRIALVNLFLAEGSLLERRGISLGAVHLYEDPVLP